MTIHLHWPSTNINMNHLAVQKYLSSIKQEETEKIKLFNHVRVLESEIAALITKETYGLQNQNPKAMKIEMLVSKKLKELLLQQAQSLERAAAEARKEAQLEKAIYEIEKRNQGDDVLVRL